MNERNDGCGMRARKPKLGLLALMALLGVCLTAAAATWISNTMVGVNSTLLQVSNTTVTNNAANAITIVPNTYLAIQVPFGAAAGNTNIIVYGFDLSSTSTTNGMSTTLPLLATNYPFGTNQMVGWIVFTPLQLQGAQLLRWDYCSTANTITNGLPTYSYFY